MLRFYIVFILLFLHKWTSAQNSIATPEIVNHKKLAYNAGSQNWDIKQGANGTMYFANNEGLLSFDGTYWKLYPLPNKTIVRSMAIGSDNRIYVGGQDEIGYFSPDATGKLVYTSLKQLIPKNHQSFADIWKIVSYKKEVFFQTNNKLFQLKGNSFKVFQASNWLFLGIADGKLIAQNSEDGILSFRNDSWAPYIEKAHIPAEFKITGTCTIGTDSTLLSTWNNGLYFLSNGKATPYPNATLQAIKPITGVIKINKESFALSTTTDGCYIITNKGKILQRYWRKTGLQNNNIISIFKDKNENLWLGLDSGIDFIAINSAIKQINPESLNEGAGYASVIYNNALYLGLSNGVYKLPLHNLNDISNATENFATVGGVKGQIWGMANIAGKLLIGSHEGSYHINGQTAQPIKTSEGYWQFTTFSKPFVAPLIVGGNYNGLTIFSANDVKPLYAIPGFTESARFLTTDNDGTVWTSHPYRGVYSISAANTLQPAVKLYNHKNGLPSALGNHVFKIKNRIVAATEKGIYEYNAKTDRFYSSTYFKGIFKNITPQYVKEDAYGNIWFVQQKMMGVVDFSESQAQIIYMPELNGKMISGFEHINPIDKKNILVGTEKGFYHINYDKYKKQTKELTVQIGEIKINSNNKDSALFGGYFGNINNKAAQQSSKVPQINYSWNSIHIEYTSPLFEQQSNLEYSYHLKGFDNGWSDWSKKTEKDYTNLPAGQYTFEVKARNNLGNESKVTTYTFKVLPPWYQTVWAYFVYTLLFGAGIYLLYRHQQKRFLVQQQKHLEEQRRLQYLHQLEMEKSEKEIIKLKNEKLEVEIASKNSELASTSMHLVQKGELLVKIKDELTKLNKDPHNKEETKDLKKVIRKLSEEERIDGDWENFAIHFNQVYNNFLITIKDKFPELNANELKLCAYLRMNLATKEIAQLMNISIRGVETGRYRLRKKLAIPTEINLFEFLLSLHGTNGFEKVKEEPATAKQDGYNN